MFAYCRKTKSKIKYTTSKRIILYNESWTNKKAQQITMTHSLSKSRIKLVSVWKWQQQHQ